MRLDRILVPIDFSAQSAGALADADALSLLGGNTILTLLHVHQLTQLAIMDFTYVEPAERLGEATAAAEAQLLSLARGLRTPEERRRIVVEVGQPLGVILTWSEKVDLIVMPTHGRTGATHFLLGSVAERVVQAARCSVLVSKPQR